MREGVLSYSQPEGQLRLSTQTGWKLVQSWGRGFPYSGLTCVVPPEAPKDPISIPFFPPIFPSPNFRDLETPCSITHTLTFTNTPHSHISHSLMLTCSHTITHNLTQIVYSILKDTFILTHSHTSTYTHPYTHTLYSHSHASMLIHTCSGIHILTCYQTHSFIHSHTPTHSYIHKYTFILTFIYTHLYIFR